jgi:FkbM family methyltransferase
MISAQLKKNGLWEPTNVRSFLRLLHEVPDLHVLDIGANIGLYTLLAAKMNRTVLAVEPLHENLNRMHKAAQLEQAQSRIIALINAISNERKELKVSLMDYNIGGSYVAQPDLIDPEQRASLTSSSVIVNSILMDDLVDVINQHSQQFSSISNSSSSSSNKKLKFVIKIDIEGYEPFAIEKSDNLFKQFEIVALFMEIGKMLEKLKNKSSNIRKNYVQIGDEEEETDEKQEGATTTARVAYLTRILSTFNKLKQMNYEPYEMNGINKLDYDKWREWPWDVYFRQCDLLNCPNHVYKVNGFV